MENLAYIKLHELNARLLELTEQYTEALAAYQDESVRRILKEIMRLERAKLSLKRQFNIKEDSD